MKRRADRDDGVRRPPRPAPLLWILLGLVGVLVLAGGGILLGTLAPELPATAADEDDPDPSTSSTARPTCDSSYVVDETAGLCYRVPKGWAGSTIDLGIGPSSTIVATESATANTAGFGSAADLPVALPDDLSQAGDELLAYACALFTVGDCPADSVQRDIDGHAALTATGSGEGGFVIVTLVDVGDSHSYAISRADEAHHADTQAIHDSLKVL